jgi:L-iditol 2-dehydrogenase
MHRRHKHILPGLAIHANGYDERESFVLRRKMRCLQLERPGSLQLLERWIPEPGLDEVLLRVTHCALCRTDAKMFERGQRDLQLPRVLGHEICGSDMAAGKRFVVWPGHACGVCAQCLRNRENLCPQMCITGFHRDGGLAEFVAVPKSSIIPVPANLPGAAACLAEPLACALNGLQQVQLSAGEKLLIYGAGPVGLLIGLAAVDRGVETWIVEKSASKFRLSEQFRRSLGIRSDQEVNSLQFDAVINAAPAAETLINGISRLRPGGCFCVFSGLVDDGSCGIPIGMMNDVHYRQLTVVGAYGCTSEQMRNAVSLLPRYLDSVLGLIHQSIRLADVPQALLQILHGECLKVVVDFDTEEI